MTAFRSVVALKKSFLIEYLPFKFWVFSFYVFSKDSPVRMLTALQLIIHTQIPIDKWSHPLNS